MNTRMIYANLVRTYNGKETLYEAAKDLEVASIRTDMAYGGERGYWGGSPIQEVVSEPGIILPEVAALSEPEERDIGDPVPMIFDLVIDAVEKAWRPDAFHLVFQSSGWDTRIIAGAIKKLLAKNGPEWLGEGLLFLSNRWEEKRFKMVMRAMGWPEEQFAAYTNGRPGEHFAKHAYDMWKFAPFPRPGSFFWYLQEWAEDVGLIPEDNVQAFTGLWANEVWYWMFPKVEWVYRANRKYRIHMCASLPIKAQWVEYPLVSLPVLKVLRRAQPNAVLNNGNALRQEVSNYAVPEAAAIRRNNWSDGYHQLSPRLKEELDDYYRGTEFGKYVPWEVPDHSGNSMHWGRWSMALLMEELVIKGVGCRLLR